MNKQVKIHHPERFNVPNIKIFNTTNQLEVTIYPKGINILNYPDQYVYPGEQAAVREFLEETGVDLNSETKKYNVKFEKTDETGNTYDAYSVTYIKVSDEELGTKVQEINVPLQKADYQDRICITVTSGKVMDDELASVEKVTLQSET